MILAQILRVLRTVRPAAPGRCVVCRSFALVLMPVVGLAAVLLLAETLTDPLWVPGVYDSGDYDDVIAVSSDVHSSGLLVTDALPVLTPRLLDDTDVPLSLAPHDRVTVHTRAPPAP
jgi:hypothetical protein